MAKVKESPWLLHYDGSSCNGCDIEVLACLTPVYDAERFGIINTGDPLQADIFLITGGINSQNQPVVKQLYDQMPRPKVVVAVGVCACTGGIFKECYNIQRRCWIRSFRLIFMCRDVRRDHKLLLTEW